MEVVHLWSPFCTRGGQQRLLVTLPLSRLYMCSGNWLVVILGWDSIGSPLSDTTHLRVALEAFKSILGLLTIVDRRRLSSRVGQGKLVVGSVNCAKSKPDLGLREALYKAPGAEAASHTGVAQSTHVPAYHPAEVWPQRQVDDGVVDGGGLGKHCWHGKCKRRDIIDLSKSSPHGHHGIRTPRRKEADADSNT